MSTALHGVLVAASGGAEKWLGETLRGAAVDVVVFPVTPSPGGSPVRLSDGRYAADAASLLAERAVVIVWLQNDEEHGRVFTDRFVSSVPPGAIVIDHTVGESHAARQYHERFAERGVRLIDAPVLWGAGTSEDHVTVMVGADDEATFQAALAIMAPYVSEALHVGGIGAGRACRLANQVIIAASISGLAEALRISRAAGVTTEALLDALTKGGADSQQLRLRLPRMAARDYSPVFPARRMQTDLGFAAAEAVRLGGQPGILGALLVAYNALVESGYGAEDCANLARLYERDDRAFRGH